MYTMYTTPVEKCHKALFYVGCGCVHFRFFRCTQDVHACTHLDVFWTQNSTQIRQPPGLCAVERIRFSQRAFAHASSACLLECGGSTLPSISNAPIDSKDTPAPRKGAFRMLNYSASSFSTLASLTQMQNSSIAFVSSATLG